jgi:hypothetical protein
MPGSPFDLELNRALEGYAGAEEDIRQISDRKINVAPKLREDLKRLDWFRQNFKPTSDDVYKYGSVEDFGVTGEELNQVRRRMWAERDRRLMKGMKNAGLKPSKHELDVWQEGEYADRDFVPSSQFKIDPSKAKSPIELGSQFIGANEYVNADVIGNFLSKAMGKNIDPRRVAWCTYFVSSLLKSTGKPFVDNDPGAAKAYQKFGTDVSDDPQPGDLWTSSGHTAIVLGVGSKPDTVRTLEGNHDDGVSEYERYITLTERIRRPPVPKSP